MKIYTKTGDRGDTGLIGGQRIRKSSLRIDCYGTVDELNAVLGLAASQIGPADTLHDPVHRVQDDLFTLGCQLAAPNPPAKAPLPQLDVAMVQRLETQIDEWQLILPPLKVFILPGGCELSARLHIARTVCRRAERILTALSDAESVPVHSLIYVNRLSDWLFVAARIANHYAQIPDVPWQKPPASPRK